MKRRRSLCAALLTASALMLGLRAVGPPDLFGGSSGTRPLEGARSGAAQERVVEADRRSAASRCCPKRSPRRLAGGRRQSCAQHAARRRAGLVGGARASAAARATTGSSARARSWPAAVSTRSTRAPWSRPTMRRPAVRLWRFDTEPEDARPGCRRRRRVQRGPGLRRDRLRAGLALDASNGQEAWRAPVAAPARAAPTVV
jgi:hypothetical protein